MLRFVVFVAIWWISNALTSIASKSEIVTDQSGNKFYSFTNLRWLMLTTLQFVIGSVISVTWIAVIKRKQLPKFTRVNKELLIVILTNLIGHLSVNVSYSFVSSSATQVIKSCEPIFMFMLLICFGDQTTKIDLNIPVFFSLILMFQGTCFFVMWDITFNIWGVLAAVVSNIAFPLRNMFLKKLEHRFNSPLEQYLCLCVYGSVLLVPLTSVKVALKADFSLLPYNSGLLAAIFHYVYNIASITVLQSVSPMYHSILNFMKRVLVILANIEYFQISMTWQMSAGVVILVMGLMLFHSMRKYEDKAISNPLQVIANLSYFIGAVVLLLTVSSVVVLQSRNNPLSIPNNLTAKVNKVATAWVYQRPIPPQVVENIRDMHDKSGGKPVQVYCGTSQCKQAIDSLNNPSITTNFVVLPELASNTSLEQWVLHHALNKILSGIHFEDLLQEVVRLAHHWSHGGAFIDPTVQLCGFEFPDLKEAWFTVSPTNARDTPSDIFKVSFFPLRHPFIKELFEFFGSKYRIVAQNCNAAKFRETVWNVHSEFCRNEQLNCPTLFEVKLASIFQVSTTRINNRFGTLSYDSRVKKVGGANLRDEIQGFPGVQFLPYVDFFLDREEQTVANREDNFTIFFNAWWGDSRTRWPPPLNIYPVMFSMHIETGIQSILVNSVSFLKRHAPIGCRDLPTLALLSKLGVDSYFSGCMTILMQNVQAGKNKREHIYIVEVSNKLQNMIPVHIRSKAIKLTHWIGKASNSLARFQAAYELIEKYAQAKVVITQRLHCAMPCVAMGIPVIFINSPYLPGDAGGNVKPSSRLQGLTKSFHTLDMFTTPEHDARRWLQNFNWNDPPRNPNVGVLMKRRATFWNVIRQNLVYYEVAHKFGMLPLTSREMIGHSQLIFHVIFPKSRSGILSYNHNAEFTWRQWRCIESIFHHHPASRVIIHSNTLEQSMFDVLTEVGYYLKVRRYNLTTLVQDTSIGIAVKEGVKEGSHSRYSHEAQLLPILLLYKFGGIYLDTGNIVVRPLNEVGENVFGSDTEEKVMKFEKGHPFLKACLRKIAENLDKQLQTANELISLIKLSSSWPGGMEKSGVQVVNGSWFYSFDVKQPQDCFNQTSGAVFDAQMNIVKSVSYVVYLDSDISYANGPMNKQLRNGTICKHLLNSHCVLCNKVY